MMRALSMFFVCIFGGYLVFNAQIARYGEMPDASKKLSYAIVLTGGTQRIARGLRLLSDGKAQQVFISGVGPKFAKTELSSYAFLDPDHLECCVDLGFQARDTAGNGAEAAQWLAAQSNQSDGYYLVTSTYHMPRAIIEMRRHIPNRAIAVIAVEGHLDVIHRIAEYGKYVAALLRYRLNGQPS